MRNSIKPLIKTMMFVLIYLVGGVVGLHFVPDSLKRDANESLTLLRHLAATLVILTGLFRICIDKLGGAPLNSILTWFFVIACGAVLIRDSWVILAFLGLILLVLLLVDTEDTGSTEATEETQPNPEPVPSVESQPNAQTQPASHASVDPGQQPVQPPYHEGS